MVRSRLLIPVIALCAGVLWGSTSTSAHDSLSADGRKAGTTQDFRIIIPEVLHILENSHPSSLTVAGTLMTPRISALQRVVLVSTLRKGFCMDLRLNQPQVADWQVQVGGSAGIWIEPLDGGYHLCAHHAGRYELALQHDFSLKDGARGNLAPALDWPVSMSLATP